MYLPVEQRTALIALAETLTREVRPSVSDPQALDQLNSAVGAALRLALELDPDMPAQATAEAANARGAKATALLKVGEAGPLRTFIEEELAPLDMRETAIAALKARTQGVKQQFPTPTEAQVLAVLSPHLEPGEQVQIRGLTYVLGGNSKQTIIFDLVRETGVVEPLVLRRDFPRSSNGKTVADEAPLLRALETVGFCSPQVWCCAPASDAGPASLVMCRHPGRPIGDHEGPRADVEGDPLAMLAGVLARLHSISIERLDLAGYSDAPTDQSGLLTSIASFRQRDLDHWAVREPILELGLGWLEAHAADVADRTVIVHGDYGFHNLMSHEGEGFLLDWEMAHPGSAAEDINRARDCLGKLASFDVFVDLYVSLGGERPDSATLVYYDVLRLIRSTINYRAAVALFNDGTNTSIRKLNAVTTLYGRNLTAIARLISGSLTGLGDRR